MRISDWSSDVCSSDLRHHDAVLAVEHLLAAAVQEEGDVRVLLGLGDAELPKPGPGDHLAEGVGEVLRREDRGHPGGERAGVFDHAGGDGEAGDARPGKAVEAGIEEGGQDLPPAAGGGLDKTDTVTLRDAPPAQGTRV